MPTVRDSLDHFLAISQILNRLSQNFSVTTRGAQKHSGRDGFPSSLWLACSNTSQIGQPPVVKARGGSEAGRQSAESSLATHQKQILPHRP
jgi:hypothetical protein